MNRGPQRVHDLIVKFGQLDGISFLLKRTYGAQILAPVMTLLAGVVSDLDLVTETFINDESKHDVEGVILLVCWYLFM
jgi:hypothetical protein